MAPPVTLSPQQQRVVDHRASDLQVIACAGSGKTESISRRVAALIAEGAAPSSIVAFTFTERAATELSERITRRVAERMGAEYRNRMGPMFVGTIHSYCFRILQDHVPRYGNYDVLDEHRHAAFLSREYHRLGLGRLKARHWAPIRDFMRTVDVIGNEVIPQSALSDTALGKCYAAYRDTLDRHHFLTFGLLITCALEALEDEAIYQRVRAPLRHLFVDEYQDINPAQQRLIDLLARPPVELTVVGDDDQSIYQWRGSDVRHIVGFRNRRPSAATVDLDTNRRSRPAIVSVANAFARSIPGRLPKEMRASRTPGESEVVTWTADTDVAEAERIAGAIERLRALGYPYRDIGVLYRSVRTSAPPLIEALRARGIPYTAGGRTGLFLQPEIAFLAEIYAWFVDGEWRDEPFGEFRPADLDRIVDGLNRVFGGDSPVPELREYLEDWRAYVLRGHRPVNLVGDFYRLLHLLGVERTDLSTPAGPARMGALARLSEVLGDFEHVHRRGRQVVKHGETAFEPGPDRGRAYFRALHNYLLHYARDAYEEFEGEPAADLDAVDIITVHQAKGLEWPVVFMPSLVQGRFPSRRAGEPQDWLLPEEVFPAEARRRYEGSEAEERRLFYVALTRAREVAYLSWFRRKTNRFEPSVFLLEVAGTEPAQGAALPLPGPPPDDREAEVPTLEISYSDLATFDECGHRYRLGHVLGFQTQVAPELGYGRAIHHVLRAVAEIVRTAREVPSREEMDAIVTREFFVPFASAQAWETMRNAARKVVKRYAEEYAEDLARIWAVERPFALHLDDGVVHGRADLILDLEGIPGGSLAIVDYKVAADEARAARHEEQLRVYSLAGRGEGLTVETAYLHELRDGTRRLVDVTHGACRNASEHVNECLARLRQGRFSPAPEAQRCENCDYRDICREGVKSQ